MLVAFGVECGKHIGAKYQRQGIHTCPTFCPWKRRKALAYEDIHFCRIAVQYQSSDLLTLAGFDMECRKHTEAECQQQGIHTRPILCPLKCQKALAHEDVHSCRPAKQS